jgi:hypothetical protein
VFKNKNIYTFTNMKKLNRTRSIPIVGHLLVFIFILFGNKKKKQEEEEE